MNVHRCQWGVPLTLGIGVRSEVALWIHMTICTGVRRFWTKADYDDRRIDIQVYRGA